METGVQEKAFHTVSEVSALVGGTSVLQRTRPQARDRKKKREKKKKNRGGI